MSANVRPNHPRKIEFAGPYLLGRTLGIGTTGKVKVGRHFETGKEVAVKNISMKYVKNYKAKLQREIVVMKMISHPNVMKLYDVLETRNNVFLILERVKGGELFEYIIQKGKLPRQEGLRIMSQIVQGVEFCHRHTICHRDLKPENLLLDEKRNIKIADFGMATMSYGKSLMTFCGSPHYGAPEVIKGEAYDGTVSDVWSLGVIFYALITGMLPFEHENMVTLLKIVQKGVFSFPPFVPDDIADLIQKMLTVDVNQRIKSHEIKFHKCWMDENGKNKFFPSESYPSPVLEMVKKYPITESNNINESVFKDLLVLGFGSEAEIKYKLIKGGKVLSKLENNDESKEQEKAQKDLVEILGNQEIITYYLLLARFMGMIEEEVDSSKNPNIQDILKKDAHRGSERFKTVTAAALKDIPVEKDNDANDIKNEDVDMESIDLDQKLKIGTNKYESKRPIRGIVVKSQEEEMSNVTAVTTPRFHRRKLKEVDSPGGPITPTGAAAVSWFKELKSSGKKSKSSEDNRENEDEETEEEGDGACYYDPSNHVADMDW